MYLKKYAHCVKTVGLLFFVLFSFQPHLLLWDEITIWRDFFSLTRELYLNVRALQKGSCVAEIFGSWNQWTSMPKWVLTIATFLTYKFAILIAPLLNVIDLIVTPLLSGVLSNSIISFTTDSTLSVGLYSILAILQSLSVIVFVFVVSPCKVTKKIWNGQRN